MGTLVEDIFAPSFDLALEKYFHLPLEESGIRRKFRKGADTLELDILAYAGNKAFVVEVKSSPNKQEHVHDYINKLQTLSSFIADIQKYGIVPVYAALDMDRATINLLTRNHIYTIIVKERSWRLSTLRIL